VLRVNAYVSLNLRKFENKIPDINFSDWCNGFKKK
jgi:hypothetical protein